MEERQPDSVLRVPVEGGSVATFSYGDSTEAIFLLNGGPGIRSKHLQVSHAYLADTGLRVVTHDQLGTGESDHPDDASLWTIERYAREVETVRTALDLGPIHVYGHSWGAMLAVEYTLTYPEAVKSLIISHGIANMPFHRRETDRLKTGFGSEFALMMRRHELAGRFDHPEYQAAETLMFRRHVCRMLEWPAILVEEMIKGWNKAIYDAMIGAEYHATGNLKDWNRAPDMHRITQPTLVLTGEHDALTPEEAMEMHDVLPNSELHMFEGIAHMPFYESPEEYFRVLEGFLRVVTGLPLDSSGAA